MRIFQKTLPVLLFLTAAVQLKAQNGIEKADSIAGRLIRELRNDTREKLFVQTDKWFYAAGEEIWMKAFIVNALSHKYYSHSKTLYAELVDEGDTAVTQLLLNIPRQQTEGFIPLSASLREGYYWLRVYTSNMPKRDTGAIFVVPLYVVNNRYPSQLKAEPARIITPAPVNETPQLSFFPEGGSLIAGTNTVVGIRATDKGGHPLETDGYITDTWDTEVAKFKTGSDGLGKCNFDVVKSRKYIAHVKRNNQVLNWDLPPVDQFASQISVKDQEGDYIKVVVSQGDSIYGLGHQTYLLGISRDSLCFASFGTDMYAENIPKKNFPAGKANLILFNDQQEVISERAVFITRTKDEVEIKTDKDNYNARDQVNVTIIAADTLKNPSIAALSVSVTDDSLVQEPVMLASLINSNQSAVVSDLAMLTQPQQYKGRSYKTTEIAKPANPKKQAFDEESSITDIKGRILDRKGQPVEGRIVTLYANKQVNIFDTDTTDGKGEFRFHMLPFLDSIPFTLQVTNDKGVKVNDKIVVDAVSPFPKFATPVSLKKKLSLQQTEQVQRYRARHMDNLVLGNSKEWLKEVIVTANKKRPSYNTSKRVSNFSYVVTGEKIQKINPNDASTAMLMVPGLHLRGGFLTLGGLTSFGASSHDEPLLIVDGVMVAGGTSPVLSVPDVDGGGMGPIVGLDPNGSPLMHEISKISPDVIDFIEVLKGPEAAYYGTRSGNGVIIVNTNRRSNYARVYENYGTLQYYPKSYHLAPQFNMPDYNNKSLKNAAFRDFRPTLYWNGHVYSNPSGKAELQFFTADATTAYTITVTGITSSGEVIYKKAKFSVK